MQNAGLALDIEIEETCCYAKQSKARATDPDGRRWEVYTVLEETQDATMTPMLRAWHGVAARDRGRIRNNGGESRTLATGAALVALIGTFGSISGAHFNPAVTVADATQGGLSWPEVPTYIFAQVVGAIGGVIAANLMFGLSVVSFSTHVGTGPAQWLAEFIATFGLLAVIWGCVRYRFGICSVCRRSFHHGRLLVLREFGRSIRRCSS